METVLKCTEERAPHRRVSMRASVYIMAVADLEGFHRFPLKPPFGLAMYTRSVFYADDYDMWKLPLPARLI